MHWTHRYMRIMPTIFCPGCGGGTVLNAFIRAVDELKMDTKNIAAVTGIGCSSWILSPYFNCDTVHTMHGRAIACATGVKLMRPDMTVVVIAGDGDIIGIGGNHFLHAARRNMDIKVFMVNNMIYGMTGGQVSPTTPRNIPTTTTPYGNIEEPIDTCEVAIAAGASYVARWTTAHPFALIKSMKYALEKKGFTFVEIVSQCPETIGKKMGMTTSEMIKSYKEKSVYIKTETKDNINDNKKENKIIIGEFVDRERRRFWLHKLQA